MGVRHYRDVYGVHRSAWWCAGAFLAGLATLGPALAQSPNPFPSTYEAAPPTDVLIVNATILDGTGRRLDRASLLLTGGRVTAIGEGLGAADGVEVIDASGRWITPGIVDPHSHLGSASMPFTPQELAAWDVNEVGNPVAPHLYVEATVRAQDPGFPAALAGGVTALQVLPGSANLFGGYGVVLKPVSAATPQAMKFPDAPAGMKMACGENPKYTYAELGRAPKSRMGIVAGYRQALEAARQYRQDAAKRGDDEPPPRAEPEAAAIAAAIDGQGLPITAFHHASEAYKIPQLLVRHGVCAVVFSNWWGFKMENYDAIRENAAFVHAAGGCVALHSDSATTGQRLNLEAAKAMAAGQQAGLAIAPEVAIRWITLNPARILGLDDRIGSLEPGKNADVVVWSGDPFSVYTKADLVFIDGALRFDRHDPTTWPVADFDLGQPAREEKP